MAEAILNPTPDQTFRIEGRGDYDFSRTLRLSDEAQRRGAVDEACNLRFHAFQHLADLIPDNEEVILEWEHPNTQAALHLLYRSAVDHFLIDDFELSAAMLEFLLDLDPEDHEEATWLLAFDYVALADYDAFDFIIGMDTANIRNMNWILGGDPDGKVFKLLEFAGTSRSVDDPWYTGDFETTYADVCDGCEGLLAYLGM